MENSSRRSHRGGRSHDDDGDSAEHLPQRDAVPVLPRLRARANPRSPRRGLVELAIDPASVVIVSDIGCSVCPTSTSPRAPSTVCTAAASPTPPASSLRNPELTVIVIMGDGGTGIGGTHLINAARRNIGVTVIVFNNLNFGMTGGQHSTTTPAGAVTSTTPAGNLEHPLDICGTVGVNGAAYVYRGTSFDDDLTERLVDAIRHPGFALLDIWELCTAYYVRANHFSRRAIAETMEGLGLVAGVLYERDVADYAAAYREAHAADLGTATSGPAVIPVEYQPGVGRPGVDGGCRVGGRPGAVCGPFGGRGGDPGRAVGDPTRRLPDHGQDRPQHRTAGVGTDRGPARQLSRRPTFSSSSAPMGCAPHSAGCPQ